MKKRLTNNWLLKLGSLVFAFCLWLVVMNVENPTTPQTFSNIKVQFVNTEVLTDQGLVYDVLDDTGVVRNITVYGPRNTVELLKSEDIVAKADFNNLTNVNTIPLEFSTNRYNSEITDIRGSISTVKLSVEKEKTIRLPLRVNAIGEPAEGYLLGNITPDQNQITVTGAESVINKIDKAIAEVDVNNATSGIATYTDVKLLDDEGKLIESDAITQKVTSVRVAVDILETKNVTIHCSVSGVPATGYMATGEIDSTPALVLIAGTNSNLKNFSRIEIPAEDLDITDRTENLVKTINIKDYLPNNIILADSEFDGKVTVTVYIGKTVSKTFKINQSQISILGAPAGFEVAMEGLEPEFDVELAGLIFDIYRLNGSDIAGYIDMNDIKNSANIDEWTEGIYSTNLRFDFQEEINTVYDIPVSVILTKIEE